MVDLFLCGPHGQLQARILGKPGAGFLNNPQIFFSTKFPAHENHVFGGFPCRGGGLGPESVENAHLTKPHGKRLDAQVA